MPFGQLVIGPPGSGKTTYCNGVSQFLSALGRRVAIVNLDPANDLLPYKPDVDVAELVCLETVMQELKLGPNGGAAAKAAAAPRAAPRAAAAAEGVAIGHRSGVLSAGGAGIKGFRRGRLTRASGAGAVGSGMVYCMEYLAANLDWLKEKLQPLADANVYVLLDCPGQVELFTQHNALKQVVEALTGAWHWRLAAVHLVDAHLCTDAAKYISALLLSLSTMLHLELPQVNVLSKVDLVRQYGDLAFNLDFYTEVQDLDHLVACLGPGPFSARFRQLAAGLCEVVEGYGLLAFTPLAVQDRASVERLVGLVDKANGAVYAALDKPPVPVPAELLAAAGHRAADDDIWSSMQERYIDSGALQEGCQESSSMGEEQQQQQPALSQPPLVAQHVRERQPMDEG